MHPKKLLFFKIRDRILFGPLFHAVQLKLARIKYDHFVFWLHKEIGYCLINGRGTWKITQKSHYLFI